MKSKTYKVNIQRLVSELNDSTPKLVSKTFAVAVNAAVPRDHKMLR